VRFSRQDLLLGKGFRPGYGIFETLRVENGKVWFLQEHWESLLEAAGALGLTVAQDFRQEASGLPPRTGRWRWVVWDGGSTHLFQEEKPPPFRPWRVELAPQRVGSANWDARYKTLSYLTRWQALATVQADEALLLNENRIVASGARSNLFWGNKGRLYTPSLECGCRAGVVRRWVLTRIPTVAGQFPLETLLEAEEAFLTNSWVGIQPVGTLLGRNLPLGPLTRQVREAYLRWAGGQGS
jgi:4-amino-4-deoxychorismate lyase